MGPTYPIFELILTINLSYLYTKFGINRMKIATHIHIHIHAHLHTENEPRDR